MRTIALEIAARVWPSSASWEAGIATSLSAVCGSAPVRSQTSDPDALSPPRRTGQKDDAILFPRGHHTGYRCAVDGSRTGAMEARPVALLAGPAWTRALLAAWAQRPLPTLGPWALGSLALGVGLLGAALIVAALVGPDGPYTPIFADRD